MIEEILPELTIICDSEAYMRNDGESQNGIEEECIEGASIFHGDRPAGHISTHVPHSIGIMALDHK